MVREFTKIIFVVEWKELIGRNTLRKPFLKGSNFIKKYYWNFKWIEYAHNNKKYAIELFDGILVELNNK